MRTRRTTLTPAVLATLLAVPTLTAGQPGEKPRQASPSPAQDSTPHTRHAEPSPGQSAALEALAVLEQMRPSPVRRLERKDASAAMPRALPPQADTIPALRFTVTRAITRAGENGLETITTTEEVVRSAEAISIREDGGATSWHFERNPRYPARPTGFLTDLANRVVLEYDDTDLRSRRVARDWFDVLTLRFDPSLLESRSPTGELRHAAGHAFERYRFTTESGAEIDVWWNNTLLLPLEARVEEEGALWSQTICGIEPSVEGGPVHPMRSRMGRMMQCMMLGDWYEEHFGCGCSPADSGLNAMMRAVPAGD